MDFDPMPVCGQPSGDRMELPSALQSGVLVGGRFRVERRSGAGAMGTVFRAHDEVEGLPVAVKVVQDGDVAEVARFTREVTILAELSHPAIVRYVAHGSTVGARYVAMEWLDGEDLATHLTRRRPSLSESLAVTLRIADALSVAHARGVVHRDIKPGNIFLPGGDFERAKLVDFGIARGVPGEQRLTQTGAIVGTPAYMSPEQIQAQALVDARSDVFSLGCVLYECLTGRPAFEGMNLMARLAKILLGEAPRLRSVVPSAPARVDVLLSRMLAKAPDERPRDGAALAAELRALDDTASGEQPDDSLVLTMSSAKESPRPTLTLVEHRLVTVVLAGDPDASMGGARRASGRATSANAGGTCRSPVLATSVLELRAAIEPHGGRLDVVAGGSFIVTIWGAGSAVDRAERAAHCALSIRARFPTLPICLTTGRGRVLTRVVEGEVLDRAARALSETRGAEIRLDEATANMLAAGFDLIRKSGALLLQGERRTGLGSPSLLGKPTPYAGRGRELAMLEGAFTGCSDESVASAALVIGPAGSGKSRLCREFLEGIRKRGEPVEILFGKGDSSGAASPFAIVADAIRRASGIGDGDPLAARRTKLAARVGRHVHGSQRERVVAFLGEMAGTPFPGSDCALRAAGENAMLKGDCMRAAWEEWLAAECAAKPVILVLEDLHWGDAATVRLIDSTLRNLAEQPLMVVALARPEVDTQFPGMWVERAVQTIRLGPLARKVCEKLAFDALGKDATSTLVKRIVDHAAGNPFFLEELVRAVVDGRGDAAPDSVLGMVEARLDAEGSAAKRVLRAASIFGERFSKAGVVALLGGESPGVADEWLDVLTSRELIAPAGPSGYTDFAFRHAIVREAAYAMLTEADRVLGHRLAAEWLEKIDGADAMAIAEHFRRGGAAPRAVAWYLRAAQHALGANDLSAALRRVQYGVDCGAAAEDLGALRLVEAEAHVWRGDLGPAEQRGSEAVALLPAGTAAWFRAVTQTVTAAGKLGAFDRVEGWTKEAAGAMPAEGAASARIACLASVATQLIFGGRYAAADALIHTVDDVVDGGIEPEAVALLRQAHAIRDTTAGDLGAALDGFHAALVSFEQVGDQRNASAMRSNLGFVLSELGDFAGAEEALRAAISAADRMGLHDLTTAAHQNLGRVLAHQGRVDEARIVEQRAVDAYRKQGDPRMAGSARAYLAQIAVLAGDHEAAVRESRAAAEALVVAPPLRAGALAILGDALLAQGHLVEAALAASEAFSQLEELGSIEEGESLVRLVYAEVLAARGDEEAYTAAAGARDHLLRRASRISNPVWRERFLHAVPANRRTLALGRLERWPPASGRRDRRGADGCSVTLH